MVTVLVSRWVGDSIQKGGIYDALIRHLNYPYLQNIDDCYDETSASDIMTKVGDLILIQTGMTGKDIG